MDRQHAQQLARDFFEGLWKDEDPWDFASSDFELARFKHLLAVIEGRRFGRVLEVGCGAGAFTQLLTRVADEVVALDISESAIERARGLGIPRTSVDFRVANVMEFDVGADGPWDLVVVSETIYYLGWLYSFFDIAWLASQIAGALKHGGHLLLSNTLGAEKDYLLLPWIVRTYRDLFVNVGLAVEREESLRGVKTDVEYEVLTTLFVKRS